MMGNYKITVSKKQLFFKNCITKVEIYNVNVKKLFLHCAEHCFLFTYHKYK